MKVYELSATKIDSKGRATVSTVLYDNHDYAIKCMLDMGKNYKDALEKIWGDIEVKITDDHYVISQEGTCCRYEFILREKEVKTLKTYKVRIPLHSHVDIEVEAENEIMARHLAMKESAQVEEFVNNIKYDEPEIIHQASGSIKVKVDWDIAEDDTDETVELPDVVEIPEDIDEEDITDWLSDTYNYCVNDWEYV